MERSFVRARQPEQKEQRRTHLLATGRALLEGGVDPRALSLNELARQAGMAKANVYRYFESREALLLALMWDEWGRWYASFPEAVKRSRRKPGLEPLAQLLSRSLGREELLCALTAMLPSVLEQNLGEETVRRFKTDTLAFFGEVALFLKRECDELPAAAWAELLRDGTHAITGLYPATHPAPAVVRVLQSPELRFFRRDFVTELERFMTALAANHATRVRARRHPNEPSNAAPAASESTASRTVSSRGMARDGARGMGVQGHGAATSSPRLKRTRQPPVGTRVRVNRRAR